MPCNTLSNQGYNKTMIEYVILCFFLLIGLGIYFLPTLNAARRDNPSINWIFFFNLIFGMTLIGWFFALWWSETDRSSIANFVGRAVMYAITAGVVLAIFAIIFVPSTTSDSDKPAAVQKHRKAKPPEPLFPQTPPTPEPATTKI